MIKMKLRAIGKIKFGFRFYLYSRAGYWHLEIQEMKHRPKREAVATQETPGPDKLTIRGENKGDRIPDNLSMGEYIDREQEAGRI